MKRKDDRAEKWAKKAATLTWKAIACLNSDDLFVIEVHLESAFLAGAASERRKMRREAKAK